MNKNNAINIAFCSDNNYLKYIAIAIQSINFNNRNNLLQFHVFLYDVPKEESDKLLTLSNNITIYSIPAEYMEKYDNDYSIKHLNRSIYIRLLVPRLLKNKVDKLIYLDADILCFRDISDIKSINIDDVICAVGPDSKKSEHIQKNIKRLNLTNNTYFNSGFLYINIKKWNDFNTENKVNEILLNKNKQLLYPDQDALNIVLQNHILMIDAEWNYLFTWLNSKQKQEFFLKRSHIPYFMHFTGARKPWYCEHVGIAQNLYLFYKHFTPWMMTPLESYESKMRINDYRIYAKEFLKNGNILKAIRYSLFYIKLKLKLFMGIRIK